MNLPFWNHTLSKSRERVARWLTFTSLFSMQAVWSRVFICLWPSVQPTSRQRRPQSSWSCQTCLIWSKVCSSQPADSSFAITCSKWWRISCLIKVMSTKEREVMSMTRLSSSCRIWARWIAFGCVCSTCLRTRIEIRESSRGTSYESRLVKILSGFPV